MTNLKKAKTKTAKMKMKMNRGFFIAVKALP